MCIRRNMVTIPCLSAWHTNGSPHIRCAEQVGIRSCRQAALDSVPTSSFHQLLSGNFTQQIRVSARFQQAKRRLSCQIIVTGLGREQLIEISFAKSREMPLNMYGTDPYFAASKCKLATPAATFKPVPVWALRGCNPKFFAVPPMRAFAPSPSPRDAPAEAPT